MKKFTKITALAVAIIMLCLSLSGCASLDLKREEQAFWTNEDSIDSITLSSGETYVILEEDVEQLVMYDSRNWQYVYVTQKDVPVLLSDTYGTLLYFSDDKKFIDGCLTGIENNDGSFTLNDTRSVSGLTSVLQTAIFFTPVNTSNVYVDGIPYHPEELTEKHVTYCKKDYYDDIMEQFENGIDYTHYAYEYSVYDEDYDIKYKDYTLSKDESKIIEKILKDVKPKAETDSLYYDYYNLCNLYHYSDDEIFAEYTCEVFASFNYDEYILGVYIDSLDAYDCYEVPKKYFDDVNKIFSKAKIAYDSSVDVEYYEYR